MIRAMIFQPDGKLRADQGMMEVAFALQDPNALVWVDFQANPVKEDEEILKNLFKFHPLAIDDALAESHVPRVDDWRDYLYIVLHAVCMKNTAEVELQTLELDIFLGSNFMVTHHDDEIPSVEHLWMTLQRDERHFRHGVDHLLYRLVDDVVASYMPVIDRLDDEIDNMEEEIFNRPAAGTLERIFAVKRAILYLRRIIGPQREALNRLARDNFPVIDDHERVYFRDVYDHLVRLTDITENIRDMVAGSLDTYLSVTNNRMNDIMKTLTVITTIFMPISFIAGFFGMNFFQPSVPLGIWTGWPAFYLTMLIIFLTPLGMLFWMRHRKWM
jgi:magnesium transporter